MSRVERAPLTDLTAWRGVDRARGVATVRFEAIFGTSQILQGDCASFGAMNDPHPSLRAWLLALSIPLAACSSATVPPSSTVSRVAPPPASTPDGTPAPAERRMVSLASGESPGSNTHRWGERSFELRRDGAQTMVRLHDRIHFQGVGMTPEGMPPTTHACSEWRALDAATAERVAPELASNEDTERSCDARRATCDALRGYLASVTPAPARREEDTGPATGLQPSGAELALGACN